MGKRQRAWARRAYDRLIAELGGQCVACGTKGTEENALEIEHKYGIDWSHQKLEWSHRISVYRAEARAGLLQVLCAHCNKHKRKTTDVQLSRPF